LSTDPLVKFHRVTGAAAALAELERVERQRIELQRDLADVERRRQIWPGAPRDALARQAINLRDRIADLQDRARQLLAQHQAEARREDALREALQARKML
jgi:hypothetical protein